MLAIAGAVDAADARVLPALFRALERRFQFGPEMLSYLMIGQSLAMAAAAPVWGSLADNNDRAKLLAAGCTLWGVWTLLMAASQGFGSLLLCRTLAGAALAAVLPISQSLVADISHESQRGRLFGALMATGNAGAFAGGLVATSLASGSVHGVEGWRVVLLLVGFISLLLAIAVLLLVADARPSLRPSPLALPRFPPLAGAANPLRRLCRLKTFRLIVIQGLFGAIPWNALSFSTMWLQHRGFSDLAASSIAAWHVIGATAGTFLGGILGDLAATRWPSYGRPAVAQISVLGGVPIAALIFYGLPKEPQRPVTLSFAFFALGLVSSWCGAGVNRPILSEVVPPSERASVMSWSIALEGASASCLGAPLVGLLAERVFGYSSSSASAIDGHHNGDALASAMLTMSVVPWLIASPKFYWPSTTSAPAGPPSPPPPPPSTTPRPHHPSFLSLHSPRRLRHAPCHPEPRPNPACLSLKRTHGSIRDSPCVAVWRDLRTTRWCLQARQGSACAGAPS
jgi:MFS family permease